MYSLIAPSHFWTLPIVHLMSGVVHVFRDPWHILLDWTGLDYVASARHTIQEQLTVH